MVFKGVWFLSLAAAMSGVCRAVPGNKWEGYTFVSCGKGINTPIVGLIHGSEPPIRRFRGVRDKFYDVSVPHGGTSVAA